MVNYGTPNVSNHHLTINTNRKIINDKASRDYVIKFQKVLHEVFSEDNLPNIVRVLCSKNDDPIHSFNLHSSIEWRGRQGRLHAHVLIFMTYDADCKVRIAYGTIKDDIEQLLGTPIYFKGQLLPKKQSMEEMQKNQIQYILKELGVE